MRLEQDGEDAMRSNDEDIVDGWKITATGDGGFGVFDAHGMVSGPFGRREQAIAAALQLPRFGPGLPLGLAAAASPENMPKAKSPPG